MAKKPTPKKKHRVILALVLALILVAVGIGIYDLATYESANHAYRISDNTLTEYTTALTSRAATAGWISKNCVLALHSLQKDLETDSQAVFYIYQLPEGEDPAAYLGRRTEQMPQKDGFVHIGTLTCRIPGDQIASAYDIKLSFTQ